MSLKIAAKAYITGIHEELTFHAGEPVGLVQLADPIPCRQIAQPPHDIPMKLLVQLDSVRGCWAFMDVSILQWRKVLLVLQTWHTKWSLPIGDWMGLLLVNGQPAMSSGREMVLDRWVESILASMTTESMSTPRKFVVVAGFVIFSILMGKPRSSYVAISVVMLLAQTGECGGQQ